MRNISLLFFSPNFTNSFVAVKCKRSKKQAKLIDSSRFAHISLPVKHVDLHFRRSKPVHLRLVLKAVLLSGDLKKIVCSFKQQLLESHVE